MATQILGDFRTYNHVGCRGNFRALRAVSISSQITLGVEEDCDKVAPKFVDGLQSATFPRPCPVKLLLCISARLAQWNNAIRRLRDEDTNRTAGEARSEYGGPTAEVMKMRRLSTKQARSDQGKIQK